MDKRIIGKWYDSGGKLTINIFDEYVNGEPKLLLSFGYAGYYNMAPNCSYEKDGYLCFELNDEYYRMVYYLKYDGSTLGGYYTQFGKSTDVKFEKLSDAPEEGEYRYEPVIPGTDGMKRIDALKNTTATLPTKAIPLTRNTRRNMCSAEMFPAEIFPQYSTNTTTRNTFRARKATSLRSPCLRLSATTSITTARQAAERNAISKGL